MLGLRTTIYKVSDLNAAKLWYSQAFDVEPYFDESFYVGFNIQGYELGLQLEENASKKGDSVLSYWGVVDIFNSYEFFISLGAQSHESPQNVGGELMAASVYDPWKNIIGIIYNPYFKLTNE